MTVQQLLEQPDVEVDVLAHLDDRWVIPCDARTEAGDGPCPRPAVWWVRCRACREMTAECFPHRLIEALAMSTWLAVVCTRCGSAAPVATWRDLFDVIPIGGQP